MLIRTVRPTFVKRSSVAENAVDKILETIERLGKAVRAIREKSEYFRYENRKLKQELEASKAENERLSESLKEKEEELRVAKLASSIREGSNTDALRQQIARLVKDIDRSVALISGQKKG